MDKKIIKTCLRKAIKLHRKYTLDLEKLEKKLGGEITYVDYNYAELVYEKEWYSIGRLNKLKKHKRNKGIRNKTE